MADVMATLRAAMAEFGGDTPIRQAMRNSEPLDDGMLGDKPNMAGHAKTAVVFHVDEHGIAFGSLAVKDGTPGAHQVSQRKMYAKKNRKVREWGWYPAISTEQLKDNTNEALDTPITTKAPEHNDNG